MIQAFEGLLYMDVADESREDIVGRRTPPTDPAEIRRVIRFRDPFNHPTVVYRRSAVQAAGGQPDPVNGRVVLLDAAGSLQAAMSNRPDRAAPPQGDQPHRRPGHDQGSRLRRGRNEMGSDQEPRPSFRAAGDPYRNSPVDLEGTRRDGSAADDRCDHWFPGSR